MSSPLWKCFAALTTFLVPCLQITNTHGLAVVGVDIGSEWMTMTTILPDESLEDALKNETMMKARSVVTFKYGEHTVGDNAFNLLDHSSSRRYEYFLDLLGKKTDNPVVDLYKIRFPHHNIIPHPKRNTVLFKHGDLDETFSPEELVAILLKHARNHAQQISGQDVDEAVISVPGYFGQAERLAMLKAAEIVGIKVLQLINNYTAAALSYGKLHEDSFIETAPKYIMFYDMGAYDTQVSIVSYQLVHSEEKPVNELKPQLTVLGVGYERNLGGLEIQLRLRDYLASIFNSLQLTSNDVTKNHESMVKLFREAGRLKNELSDKTHESAEVKQLIDEKDMDIQITREELDELCKDLFDKVLLPARKALESSGLAIELIEKVITVGNGSKVLGVQDRLIKDLKLGQPLETDRFVIKGVAFKAADLSNASKEETFIIKDAILFPIQVTFDEEVTDDSEPAKKIKHVLFGHMNSYPQHNTITFGKRQQDFNFTVGYAELIHLDESEVGCLGSLSLSNIKLNGIRDVYTKYQGQEGVDVKETEAHFSIYDSGILVLHSVELLIEKTVSAKDVDSKNSKFETIRETIHIEHEYLCVPPVQGEELQSLIDKFTKLKEIDLVEAHKTKSMGAMFEIIYKTRLKLKSKDFISISTDTERKLIEDKCTEFDNWLENIGWDAKAEELDAKVDDLKKIVARYLERNTEHLERPSKLKTLNSELHRSILVLNELKTTTLGDTPFTQIEINTFETLIYDIKSWRDELVEKQKKLPKNVDPVLTIKMIEKKYSILEGETNKFSSWKSENNGQPKAEAPTTQTDDEEVKTSEEGIVETETSQDVSERLLALNKALNMEYDEDFDDEEFDFEGFLNSLDKSGRNEDNYRHEEL